MLPVTLLVKRHKNLVFSQQTQQRENPPWDTWPKELSEKTKQNKTGCGQALVKGNKLTALLKGNKTTLAVQRH